jgi:hypothetical protein
MAVRSLQSDLAGTNREIWAGFTNSAGNEDRNSLQSRLNGGEGGIRTLGTGVSPYNGLANSTRPLPIARNQSVTVTSGVPSRAESGCSADVCAPEYAPFPTDFLLGTEARAPRLVRRSVRDLRPHPSYARHNLSAQPFKVAALDEQGDLGFSHPLVITRDRFIIDGYARWELAKRRGRPILHCIEYDLTSDEALEELIRKHRRSHGLSDFIRIELALDLDSYFKEEALLNRQAGGRLKGLSKLTAAERVNSRAEVARIAQVSVGNVHKVKYILTHACAQLREAARTAEVSINLADKWSHEPESNQQECLRVMRIERGIRRKARHLIAAELARCAPSSGDEQVISLSDLVTLVNRLTTIAPERSKEIGSVEVKLVDGPGHAMFITAELIRALKPMPEVYIR